MVEENNNNSVYNVIAFIYGIIAIILLFIGYQFASNNEIILILVAILGILGLILVLLSKNKK